MKHNTNQDNQEFQVNQDESGQSPEQPKGGGQKPPLTLLQAALDYAKDGWAVLRELKEDPPAILAKTRRKKGATAAKKQRIAILLSKARKDGARTKKA